MAPWPRRVPAFFRFRACRHSACSGTAAVYLCWSAPSARTIRQARTTGTASRVLHTCFGRFTRRRPRLASNRLVKILCGSDPRQSVAVRIAHTPRGRVAPSDQRRLNVCLSLRRLRTAGRRLGNRTSQIHRFEYVRSLVAITFSADAWHCSRHCRWTAWDASDHLRTRRRRARGARTRLGRRPRRNARRSCERCVTRRDVGTLHPRRTNCRILRGLRSVGVRWMVSSPPHGRAHRRAIQRRRCRHAPRVPDHAGAPRCTHGWE